MSLFICLGRRDGCVCPNLLTHKVGFEVIHFVAVGFFKPFVVLVFQGVAEFRCCFFPACFIVCPVCHDNITRGCLRFDECYTFFNIGFNAFKDCLIVSFVRTIHVVFACTDDADTVDVARFFQTHRVFFIDFNIIYFCTHWCDFNFCTLSANSSVNIIANHNECGMHAERGHIFAIAQRTIYSDVFSSCRDGIYFKADINRAAVH